MVSHYVCLVAVALIFEFSEAAYNKEYNGIYHTRFETLDLDLILSSKRLVANYVDCLRDKRPCTAEGYELKRILPDALKTKCSKCTYRQKEGARKVISVLQNRYPHHWKTLLEKWNLAELELVLSGHKRKNTSTNNKKNPPATSSTITTTAPTTTTGFTPISTTIVPSSTAPSSPNSL